MVALPLATNANPLILHRHCLSSLPDPAPMSLSIRIDFECPTRYRHFFTICFSNRGHGHPNFCGHDNRKPRPTQPNQPNPTSTPTNLNRPNRLAELLICWLAWLLGWLTSCGWLVPTQTSLLAAFGRGWFNSCGHDPW